MSESLIAIKEASRILGVSEVALRRWTDEGAIKAFITPGGHRRYAPSELKRIASSRQKLYVMDDFMSELSNTTGLHGEIARKNFLSKFGQDGLTFEFQERLAGLGRETMQLVIRYITEPARRNEIIQSARDAGYSHGEIMARLGVPLTEAVRIFIQHREPMVKAASDFIKKHKAVNGRIFTAITLTTRIMDEMLVSLVAGYQKSLNNQTISPNEAKE